MFGFRYRLGRSASRLFSRHRSDRAYFGAPLARRIIFAVMPPGAVRVVRYFTCFTWGSWQGFEAWPTNLFVARIATASFMAYALGQILDVRVFNRLRQNHRWWMALPPRRCSATSAIHGLLLHCLLAQPGCVYVNTGWKLRWWTTASKVLISIVFFLPRCTACC
ncbi:queuosine precursor transporter [Enterobacter cloacae subsp. cloacae]|nr:queuosine precursor transporter [Enterobacter cloacae subsp. cloacae]